MAKYQQYEEYKNSGVKWLGELPKHWRVWKLNHFAPIITCGVASTPEYIDEGVVFLSAQNVKHGKIDLSKGHKFISQKSHMELTKNRMPRKNDILLSRVGTVGEACIVDVDFEFSIFVSLTHLRLNDLVCRNDFFVYLCSSKYVKSLHKAVILVGGGVGNLNVNDLREYKLPLPTIKEQIQIANFLDHETAQIDTLIEKQQTLIQLLKEKRQAVISYAVTKGLNPNAPMKDSGIEWLGEVPESWIVVPVKHISKIRYGIGEPPKYQEEGTPLIRATNIRSGKISEAGLVFVNSEDIPENRIVWLNKGDIIVVRSGAGTGDSSIIPSKYEGSIAGFDMVVRPTGCLPEFLGYVLLSNYVRNSQFDLEKTRAAQPHLNAEELGDSFILLPTDEEQRLIVAYVDQEILKFDKLIIKANQQIQLMQERRTALISAAVTGKIDVRGWQVAK